MLTSFFVLACQHGSHVSSARPLLLRIQVVQSGPGASQAPVICRKSLAILSWFRIAPRPSHEVSKNFIFIFKNLINILYYFFKIVCFRHCFPHTVYVNWKRLLQHCVTLSDWYGLFVSSFPASQVVSGCVFSILFPLFIVSANQVWKNKGLTAKSFQKLYLN